MDNRAISVEHLSKTFSISLGVEKAESLVATIVQKSFKLFQKDAEIFEKQALKDISFKVMKGEVLGIIGPNGAGKSTLLKVISRITAPTNGRIQLYGSIASLIEVGVGFHFDLTGRENIYINGAMLGMKRSEINSKLDEIIAFSGVEKYIDSPIKKYSSGMQMRLGFAVAAHLDAEILLMDEILAVGDTEFQKKCLKKINEISGDGRTVLFVSHNMGAIKGICKRAIYLKNGQIIDDDIPEKVIQNYLSGNTAEGAETTGEMISSLVEYIGQSKDNRVQINRIFIMDSEGSLRNKFNSDEEIIIGVSLKATSIVKDLRVGVSIADGEGQALMTSQTGDDPEFIRDFPELLPGNYNFYCTIPPNLLGNKQFFINVEAIHPYHEHFIIRKVLGFEVVFQGHNNLQRSSMANVYFRPQLKWTMKQD